MSNYYLLAGKNMREVASAFTSQASKLDHELIAELDGQAVSPFDLELKRIRIGKNGLVVDDDLTSLEEPWLDYQPNNLAWPLMSERMKLVVESKLTGNESVDWISINVKGRNEERRYFIPRFNRRLDVLDLQNTKFVDGTDHIRIPVFSLEKIKSYTMFPKPLSDNFWKITRGLYVSEELKKAIVKQKLTGVTFEKTRVE